MRKAISVFVFGLVVVLSAVTAQAASNPVIVGQVSGRELCPQYICGAAIFVAGFHGQIGSNHNATGLVATALNHGDLPTEIGATTPIYFGGVWQLQTLFRQVSGIVERGEIRYNGNNTFHITVTLDLIKGGSGTMTFSGTLDHNPLIPTIVGTISQ